MQYIRYVPNIENISSTKTGRLFIEDMARLLMPSGVPQAAARLYGYLLLCPTPASLDQISDDLEISKSSASVAAAAAAGEVHAGAPLWGARQQTGII